MAEVAAGLPVGPEVDAWPRPLPARTAIMGTHVVLEPLHRRHAAELFEAASGAEASFTYVPYGPFPTRDSLNSFIATAAGQHDPMMWAIRPVASGVVCGWLGLMDMQPENAALEIGRVWFSARLQRTRAATEAIFLLLKRAADELGYRRIVWKCDTLNAASIRAAQRLGFTHEGTLRAHKIVKGRQRDSAMFSMTAAEWPARRDALTAWLAPENFAPDGTARQSLVEIRARLAA